MLEHLHVAHKSSLRLLDLTGRARRPRRPKAVRAALPGLVLDDHDAQARQQQADRRDRPDAGGGLRSDTCNINSLDLSGNDISGAVLARVVRTNTSLTSLDFRKNPIDDNALWLIGGLLLEEDCGCRLGSLCTFAFEVFDDARTLSMRDQKLAAGAARCLIGVMKFNVSVTALDLSGCDIASSAATSLSKALGHNRTLTTLDLSHNPLSDVTQYKESELGWHKSPFYLFAGSVGSSESLQSLTLGGASLPLLPIKGKRVDLELDDNASSLRGAAAATHKVLDLGGKSINPLAGIIIGSLVQQNTALTELSLHNNAQLGPDGAKAIVDRLNIATLRTLDLNGVIPSTVANDSKATQRQAERLAKLCSSISRLSALEKLTLDKNSLVDFAGIGVLPDLKGLTVNNNKIETFPENLCQLRSLRRLARAPPLLELPIKIGQSRASSRSTSRATA